jgi:hypothetical protein
MLAIHIHDRVLQTSRELVCHAPPDVRIANRRIRDTADKLTTAVCLELRRVARHVWCRRGRMPRFDLVDLADHSFEDGKA